MGAVAKSNSTKNDLHLVLACNDSDHPAGHPCRGSAAALCTSVVSPSVSGLVAGGQGLSGGGGGCGNGDDAERNEDVRGGHGCAGCWLSGLRARPPNVSTSAGVPNRLGGGRHRVHGTTPGVTRSSPSKNWAMWSGLRSQ